MSVILVDYPIHMKTKIRSFALALICLVLLSSCAALRTPGEPVTLTDAVNASVDALKIAEKRVTEHGHSWGLLPAEVTLTYHISDEQRRGGGVKLGAGVEPISLGGDVSLAESTQRGNTIVMKFTKGGD